MVNRVMNRSLFVALFIAIQVFLATLLGFVFVYYATVDKLYPGVYISGVPVGGLSREQAKEKLRSETETGVKNYTINIVFNEEVIYSIKGSDIDCSIDYDKTVKSAFGNKGTDFMLEYISGYILPSRKDMELQISLDRNMLKQKVVELSKIIGRESENAEIYYKNGELVKTPHIVGRKLNIDNTVDLIADQISEERKLPVVLAFKTADGSKAGWQVENVMPGFTLDMIDKVNSIISSAQTSDIHPENQDSARLASGALNKVFIPSGAAFSFNGQLYKTNAKVDNAVHDEGYCQMASALYEAVLKAGVDAEGIKRTPHVYPVEFAGPGLDAVVAFDGKDFSFVNSLNSPVVIFSELEGNTARIYIAGGKQDRKIEIKVDIMQKFLPSVITTVINDLPDGSMDIKQPGKSGIAVKVIRSITENGVAKNEDISTDKYKAMDKIVEVGPNTDLGGIIGK